MTIKVLIIDPDIAFIVPLKRALEALGDYAVSGFANGGAALDLARRERYDIAVLDAHLDDMAIPLLIGALRNTQPNLPILLSSTDQAGGLNVQGVIIKPYLARQLAPLIRETLDKAKPISTVPTAPMPPVHDPSLSVDFIEALPAAEPPVQPDDTFYRLIRGIREDDTNKRNTIQSLNQILKNLSDSEPPIPENATIRDMVSGLESGPMPPTTLPESESTPDEAKPEPDIDLVATTLSVASDDTVPLDQLTLKAFLEKVKTREVAIVPMLTEALKTIDEPSFVTTVVESDAPTVPTRPINLAELAEPVKVEQAESAELLPEPSSEAPAENVVSESEEAIDLESAAKLAVQLTQISVNSTAQATLLTRGDVLIASAGAIEDIQNAVEHIKVAWTGAESEGNTLIRYIYLPALGDFLLYSTKTLDSMILSMLFSADTSVKVIRKQAAQLMMALESVPDVATDSKPDSQGEFESEAARTLISRPTDLRPPEGLRQAQVLPPTPRAEGPYAGYSFVWLPHVETISPEVSESLLNWLSTIAAEHFWQIDGVEIQPGYVSVQISIPANETATTTVETLMAQTAIRAESADLWADGYYIVAPGRPVTQQEIAQFVEYQRSVA